MQHWTNFTTISLSGDPPRARHVVDSRPEVTVADAGGAQSRSQRYQTYAGLL